MGEDESSRGQSGDGEDVYLSGGKTHPRSGQAPKRLNWPIGSRGAAETAAMAVAMVTKAKEKTLTIVNLRGWYGEGKGEGEEG